MATSLRVKFYLGLNFCRQIVNAFNKSTTIINLLVNKNNFSDA